MIQHERQVERRIAEPRAFGVENHRTHRTGKKILRAEIAVDQHAFGAARRFDQREKTRRQVRVGARGCDEIRLEPDREENVVGRKTRGKIGAIGSRAVDATEYVADRGRNRKIDRAVAQLRFPRRMAVGGR